METFIDRLENEKKELVEKISKLEAFIKSEKFKDISPVQKTLLEIQYAAMTKYSHVLSQRLEDLLKA